MLIIPKKDFNTIKDFTTIKRFYLVKKNQFRNDNVGDIVTVQLLLEQHE